VDAIRTPIGFVPRPSDIDLTGLELPPGTLDKLLEVRPKDWLEELGGINKFFKEFKKDLPKELWEEYKRLNNRLEANE
jgi:phosphoenolpyruvate carboxykinase (GTP)